MEKPVYAEMVAFFDVEETYLACVPALEALAKKHGFDKVTESLEDVIELDSKEFAFQKTSSFSSTIQHS